MRQAHFVAPAGALVAAALAVVALWQHWRDGGELVASKAIMVPASAAGVLLCAAALLFVVSRRVNVARVLGAVAMALGLVIVAQYALSWQSDAAPPMLVDGWGRWAQRPSPPTGLCLSLIGVSLLACCSVRFRRRYANAGATGTLIIALAGLAGHAYGASVLYAINRWGGLAITTATAFVALAVGVIYADPSRGLAAVSVSDTAGGHLLRRLIPAALIAPLLLGWLALYAQESGLVNAAFGTAVETVTLIVLLAIVIIRQAMTLHALDAERAELLERERASRERATSILESITDAFFTVDREWRFTFLNHEAERLLQRPREELLGRSVWSQFPAAVGATFQHEYERAVRQQVTVHFEAFYAPLGIWFEVRAYPAAEGLSVYFRDVTDRRVAHEELRKSEERYRLLADMVPQHIWTTDANGQHTYFSRRWYDFTGMTPEQTLGEGWMHLLHPDDRDRTIARWQRSLKTGEPYAVEYRFRNADGSYCWFLGQAAPLRNEKGEIVQWFGTLTDISERKRLEEERERLSESRAGLMRGFSHDVRNPLTAADLTAQMLELGDLQDEQREDVQRIRRSIHTSLRLIDDLLDVARAEAGQIDIECVNTDIGKVAREVADDFSAPAATAGITLQTHVPQAIEADTDPTRLRQILANLLSNAVKYAPRSHVTIGARKEQRESPRPGEWIAITVSDTGPGIPPDKREAIFQEYTRLDPEAQKGAGIGLAISRRIARLLGGDLAVESEAGRGATFTLWLPPGRV